MLGERLRTLSDHGVSILLVDHDMSLVLSVCERVIVMDFGRVIADGPAREIRSDPAVVSTYLGAHTLEQDPADSWLDGSDRRKPTVRTLH